MINIFYEAVAMSEGERYKRKRSTHFGAASISSSSERMWQSAHDLVDPLPSLIKEEGLLCTYAMAWGV